MHIVRIIFVPILVALLFLLSSAGVLVTAISQTATNREQIKTLLSQRAIYEGLESAISEGALLDFEDNQDKPDPQQDVSSQADKQAIQQIVQQYFTVDLYNRASQTLVDSFYDWFEAKSERPEFAIPITDNKQEFQNFVTSAFVQRYNSLPACPPGTVVDASFNPLESSCQVAGFNSEQIAAFINEQADQPEFQQLFDSATLNSDTFSGDITTEDTENVQFLFKTLKNLTWLFPLLWLITAGTIMLVLFNRNRSFKTVTFSSLPPAFLLLVFSLLGKTWTQSQLTQVSVQDGSQQSSSVDNLLAEVLRSIYGSINNRVLLFSSLIVVISIILLATNYWLIKRNPHAAASAKPPQASNS